MSQRIQKTSDGLLYAKLNTGARMPLVQFGTWPGENADRKKLEDAIYSAIAEAGYRGIDTAELYGTEPEVGRAVTRAIKEGLVKREELFITTKVWNNHHAKEDIEPAVQESLKRMDLEYVDLVLIHWPVVEGCKGPVMKPSLKETWQALEEVADKGLAKAIGLSNWSIKKTEDLLSYARIPPAVNQVEIHPGFRNTALLEYNLGKGIHTSAWGPLGGQFPGAPRVIDKPEIRQVAERLGKTPGQITLRWGLQRGESVLPKTATPSRVKENINLDFQIPEADMQLISSIKDQIRQSDLSEKDYFSHFLNPEGPYRVPQDLWDD